MKSKTTKGGLIVPLKFDAAMRLVLQVKPQKKSEATKKRTGKQ